MATSSAEIPEVMVGGRHVSIEELDNLRDAVCLLKWQSKDKSKQWSGYGFYANVKTKKQGTTLDINCIITIYDDIFLEMEEHGSDMVAVFHRESDKKEAFDLPLVPFNLLAHGGTLPLDYALIFIDESKMKAKGVKPILADGSELPDVQPNDEVHMIHHPGTLKKHSEDKARNVTRHCIRYHAKTLEGPPGSPVFVFRDSKFLLVAVHCNNKREGVLVSYILDDLHIPSVLSKLPEPRQNPFVRALSWALSWLSPSFLLGQRSAGSVLSWPLFSPSRVVPSTRTRPMLLGSAAPRYETIEDSSSDDFSLDDEVIHRSTKLTNEEIIAMSRKVRIEWDDLAALMDIPYSEREEIRINYVKYPSMSSKAKRVLELFNESKSFDRRNLIKCFAELRRPDLTNEMCMLEDESEEVFTTATATSKPGISEVQPEISEVPLQNDTPLSSREMYKLSRYFVVHWETLAYVLDITSAEMDDIRYSLLYTTSHSRAEKILAIFNNRKDFSRQKLAECLEKIGLFELKEPIIIRELKAQSAPLDVLPIGTVIFILTLKNTKHFGYL